MYWLGAPLIVPVIGFALALVPTQRGRLGTLVPVGGLVITGWLGLVSMAIPFWLDQHVDCGRNGVLSAVEAGLLLFGVCASPLVLAVSAARSIARPLAAMALAGGALAASALFSVMAALIASGGLNYCG